MLLSAEYSFYMETFYCVRTGAFKFLMIGSLLAYLLGFVNLLKTFMSSVAIKKMYSSKYIAVTTDDG